MIGKIGSSPALASNLLRAAEYFLKNPGLAQYLTENARKSAKLPDDDAEGADLRVEIKKLDSKINRLSDLLSKPRQLEHCLKK